MLHNLEQFTRKYVEFTTEELFTLAHLFEPLTFNENEFVIAKNQDIVNLYFLDNGVLKSYIENNNRMYHVKFYFSPIFFSDLNAVMKRKETNRNFVTVKKSDVFIAKLEDIKKLNAKSEKHNLFFKMIFKDDYMFN